MYILVSTAMIYNRVYVTRNVFQESYILPNLCTTLLVLPMSLAVEAMVV